jgi:uncharacterized membrane protein YvbJ
MSESIEAQVARIQERIGVVHATAEKAHERIDSVNKEVKDQLKVLSEDVKILLGYMNHSKGSKSSMIFAISTLIAVIGIVAKLFIK